MINTLIFILIVTSFLSGCVVIAKKSFDEIIQKPLATQSCRPTAAKLTFYEEFRHGYTTKLYIHPRERRPQDIVWASDFINDEIIRTGYFTTGLESPNYLIEFQTYYSAQANFIEQTWFWSTIVTLGIIPSWGHGSIQIKAIVKDPFGKILEEFKSHEAEFHTINWLILAPFNIGNKNTNKEMVQKISPKLTDEILKKMIAAHIICDR
tara:strand:- start:20004 stop:20627 length:624 start_codon:yes stop_codon:yes gene_type:complete